MKKATKGALAAAAAGSLLLGGAGSLAYWTSTSDVNGASITSGHLKLVPATGTGVTAGCTPWKLVIPAVLDDPSTTTVDESAAATTADFASQKIVPGDELTRVCNYTIDMTADNLKASLTVTGGGLSGGLANGLSVSDSVYKVTRGGSTTSHALSAATNLANSDAIELDLSVKFTDTGGANDAGDTDDAYNNASGLPATLAALTVSATQAH